MHVCILSLSHPMLTETFTIDEIQKWHCSVFFLKKWCRNDRLHFTIYTFSTSIFFPPFSSEGNLQCTALWFSMIFFYFCISINFLSSFIRKPTLTMKKDIFFKKRKRKMKRHSFQTNCLNSKINGIAYSDAQFLQFHNKHLVDHHFNRTGFCNEKKPCDVDVLQIEMKTSPVPSKNFA